MTPLEMGQAYSMERVRGQYVNSRESIRPAAQRTAGKYAAGQAAQAEAQGFRNVLEEKITELGGGIRFSKHASERLESRRIDLTAAQQERLAGAVKKAEAKGIKESLVMLDNLAFIVNVKSGMVVTAVGQGEEKIFSNIDGAVIV